MNIEIKYQAEDGEIRYYHFESWELAEDDAFREAMQEFTALAQERTKSSHPGCIDWCRPQLERITRLMMAAGIGRNHFRGITKMVAGTNTANQGKEDSHEV